MTERTAANNWRRVYDVQPLDEPHERAIRLASLQPARYSLLVCRTCGQAHARRVGSPAGHDCAGERHECTAVLLYSQVGLDSTWLECRRNDCRHHHPSGYAASEELDELAKINAKGLRKKK